MSKIARKLGARFGLEDDTPDIGEAGDTPIEEETSAASAEVAEAAAEVAEADQGADKLEEIHEGLSDLAEKLEEAIAEDQPVGTEAAAYIRMHINHLVGKYGLTDDVMPSLESFGGSAGRRSATISLEKSVKEMLKSFWDMIMKQLNKVKAFVKNWYLKVLDAAPRLKKKAEAIAEKATKTTGSMDGKTVNIGQLRALHINKKSIEPDQLANVMKDISTFSKARLGSTVSGQYETTFNDLDKVLGSIEAKKPADVDDTVGKLGRATGADAAIEKLRSAVTATDIDFGIGSAAAADGRFADGVKAESSKELPGGKALFVLQPAKSISVEGKGNRNRNNPPPSNNNNQSNQPPSGNTGSSTDTVPSFKRLAAYYGIRLESHNKKSVEIDSSGEFKTMSTSQVQNVADMVAEICDHIITYKKAWQKREEFMNKFDAAAKKAINSAEKETGDKDSDTQKISIKTRAIKDIAGTMADTWRTSVTFDTTWINYCLSTSRAALVYCEASLGQYK